MKCEWMWSASVCVETTSSYFLHCCASSRATACAFSGVMFSSGWKDCTKWKYILPSHFPYCSFVLMNSVMQVSG